MFLLTMAVAFILASILFGNNMIVVLDTAKGHAHNFKTRKDAGEFIGISLPTLRAWLKEPFYLHKTLIITHTSNEKVKKSNRALLKKQMAQFASEAIDRVKASKRVEPVQGSADQNPDVPINGSRPEEPTDLDRADRQVHHKSL